MQWESRSESKQIACEYKQKKWSPLVSSSLLNGNLPNKRVGNNKGHLYDAMMRTSRQCDFADNFANDLRVVEGSRMDEVNKAGHSHHMSHQADVKSLDQQDTARTTAISHQASSPSAHNDKTLVCIVKEFSSAVACDIENTGNGDGSHHYADKMTLVKTTANSTPHASKNVHRICFSASISGSTEVVDAKYSEEPFSEFASDSFLNFSADSAEQSALQPFDEFEFSVSSDEGDYMNSSTSGYDDNGKPQSSPCYGHILE
jgi:hypothetical protein